MIRVLQAAGLAICMAVAGAATSIPASAQSLELQIGPDGVRPIIRDNQRDNRRDDRRGPPRGCSEREARAIARDYGLRDARVIRVTPSRVVVEGRSRRGTQRIMFANRRGCPEL